MEQKFFDQTGILSTAKAKDRARVLKCKNQSTYATPLGGE